MNRLARLDHRYLWHPFTQMKDWLRREPIVIRAGEGAWIEDIHGNRYLDANSSIWTNLHGHRHPALDRALKDQLKKIAHSSALGLANEPASVLAEKLMRVVQPKRFASKFPNQPRLGKIFYSDDGSTAMEVALKLAFEFARRTGRARRPKFLSLAGAYHGDTIGAVSVGHIDLFHKAYAGLLFKTDTVPSPYCYRCRFNRAKPERSDARAYRKCNWECVSQIEKRFSRATKESPYAAMVVEPLIQGAAGMIPQPAGWLSRVAEIVRSHGAQLIADEVMTGFGRTGTEPGKNRLFACHQEGVQPDFLAVAKGLTGGYLPMAATMTTRQVFDAFLGEYEEFKTFFHGHSYTANQLGAAVASANLDLLEANAGVREELQKNFARALDRLWQLPHVGDIRQVGLIAGIELVRDWRTREPFPLEARAGMRVCEAMTRFGVLTRPIGNVIALMPPYCTSPEEIQRMAEAIEKGIVEVFGEIR